MTIVFISDIILNTLKNQLSTQFKNLDNAFNYYEDINLGLLTFNFSELKDGIVVIHSDQIFHQKPIEWQKKLLGNINRVAEANSSLTFVISNSMSSGFSLTPVKKAKGILVDSFIFFKEEIDALHSQSNVYFFDFQSVITNIGFSNSYNYELGFLYQMPYTKKLIACFVQELISFLNFLSNEEKKVIILDCDNTLWGGVVGEDGIDGIKCDKNNTGIVYYNFQVFLKLLLGQGFLLCLNSKNNIEDVKEAFDKIDMPLKWDDFIVKEVNWDLKSNNIKSIANKLNLGESSFVFIDDNDYELEIVRKNTEVKSIYRFSPVYSDFLKIINSNSFRRKNVLDADVNKNKMYKVETLRNELAQQYTSLEEFINELDIKIDIEINNDVDLPRLSQMTEKTNQFNFNKKYYTIDELRSIINNNGLVFSLKLSDKFGSYGIVGLLIAINISENVYFIENFLMSCRALGKNVEFNFFDYVMNYFKSHGLKVDYINFKKTEKNIPAINFLKKVNYEDNIREIK
jgi:FkbH-like protein